MIDQYYDNGWLCRKWFDGTAECWRRISEGEVNITGPNGSLYDANTGTDYFPTNFFIDIPQVQTTVRDIESGSGAGHFVGVMPHHTKSNLSFRVMSSIAGQKSFYIYVYAIGQWK